MPGFILTGKPYEVLKWVVTIVLPAVGAAYFGLGEIYGWNNTTAVLGTLTIIATLLGTVFGVSNVNYNRSEDRFQGSLNMKPDDLDGDRWVYSFDLKDDVDTLADKDVVTFKVNHDH